MFYDALRSLINNVRICIDRITKHIEKKKRYSPFLGSLRVKTTIFPNSEREDKNNRFTSVSRMFRNFRLRVFPAKYRSKRVRSASAIRSHTHPIILRTLVASRSSRSSFTLEEYSSREATRVCYIVRTSNEPAAFGK